MLSPEWLLYLEASEVSETGTMWSGRGFRNVLLGLGWKEAWSGWCGRKEIPKQREASVACSVWGLVPSAPFPAWYWVGGPSPSTLSLSHSFPAKNKADEYELAGDNVRINDKICKALQRGGNKVAGICYFPQIWVSVPLSLPCQRGCFDSS